MRKTLLTTLGGVAATTLALSLLVSVQGAEREVFTVEIGKIETVGSEFVVKEFGGHFTTHSLLEAVTADGIAVHKAPTEIESLNRLLWGASLHRRFKGIVLPKEAEHFMRRVSSLSDSERTRLNRLILEAAYPQKCPKKEMKDMRRDVSVTIRFADAVALTQGSYVTAFVLGNGKEQNLPPDAFGPPQSFALKGTRHELEPRKFRIQIRLPVTKTRVVLRFDHNGAVYEKTIEP